MNVNTPPYWMVRSFGSATFTPAVLVSLVGITLWSIRQPASLTEGKELAVILITLAAVALGCAALTWVRPQRAGLSPPHIMLSLGFGGMLLGLLYDGAHAGPARLNDLCAQSAALGFLDSLKLHMEFLPGMHAGMLAGGLLAIPSLRLLRAHCGRYLCSLWAQNLMCSGWMLIGMTAGALWFSRWTLTSGENALSGMLGGMFMGMTWGMVLSVALYRGFFALRGGPPRVS
ncbi:MAG: hypothetical protein A3E79_13785 [Burkholderiales bacterium RIFCSPHIGHO2_12_FULL_61_11]|nr:MAG: hypothetical protein A3E79_13785 [Burkholderiales bacterium RIFCSPHIGHO2_12_FULL_61_11]